MNLSEFDFDLPPKLIAQKPLPGREQSRMMVLNRKTGEIIHSRFQEFVNYIKKGNTLVLNTTKVIPARAWGKKNGKELEFLFLKEKEKGIWEVLCRPARKVRVGDILFFPSGLQGKVIRIDPEGRRLIQFSSGEVKAGLKEFGYAPLPPYIKRKKVQTDLKSMDLERYQTVFAQKEGSIAAPTAGLHFTAQVLEKIEKKKAEIIPISLNVGLATFQPVRVTRVEDHRMLEETYTISRAASEKINLAKKENRPVLAVGTTSVRALESAFKDGKISVGIHSTNLFIYPGYRFKVVDRLLTNFHLPKSTLLMLVSAFAATDFLKAAYDEAVRCEYRFFSYGDCMLIL
ncbi:tRNA preQ1(34) S-adenosylmethionine ribosyltransferase-isomerase QueA [Acidobacteriota bacterium]